MDTLQCSIYRRYNHQDSSSQCLFLHPYDMPYLGKPLHRVLLHTVGTKHVHISFPSVLQDLFYFQHKVALALVELHSPSCTLLHNRYTPHICSDQKSSHNVVFFLFCLFQWQHCNPQCPMSQNQDLKLLEKFFFSHHFPSSPPIRVDEYPSPIVSFSQYRHGLASFLLRLVVLHCLQFHLVLEPSPTLPQKQLLNQLGLLAYLNYHMLVHLE